MDFDKDKFYLGKLCNHNHKWNELEQSLRYCSINRCVQCIKERRPTPEQQRAEYQKNREKRLQTAKKCRDMNPQRVKESRKKYREKNKEKIKGYMNKWEETNKEKRSDYHRKYCSDNSELISERRKNYRKTEKGKLAASRDSKRKKARKQGVHLVKYTDKQLKERYEQFSNCCSYCLKETKLFRDHFIPVSKGGSDCLGNIVPACLICNSSKQNADPMTWYKSQDFYSPTQWKKILKILGKTELNYTQIPLF